MNSRLLLLLFICISLNTYAQINIDIQPSRTSGVAPLYVFFDVRESTGLTDNDYLNANFFWNFDDPTGKYNETRGFVAAHVFEYSGEYTVTVNATDKNGNSVTETVVISVEEFSGTTYYFSASGNDDDNPGTEENPFQSVTKAISLFEPNTRLLFRRGDTFPSEVIPMSDINGPIIIGAYGSGNAPVFYCTENTWGIFLLMDETNDIRIMDIHLRGVTNDRAVEPAQGGFNLSGNPYNNLILRAEVENIARNASGFAGYYNGVFDCNFHDFASYGCFAVADGIAFVGNKSRRQTGNEHFYRTQGGNGQFIAYNDFDEVTDAKSSIQIRGDGTTGIVILSNKVALIAGAHPQNDVEEEYVSNCLIEGNILSNGFGITAKNIVVRNNLISGLISLPDHPLVGISDNVKIYNNSFYGSMNSMVSDQGTNIMVKNNSYYSTTTDGYSSGISFSDISQEEVEIDNNSYWVPNKGEDIWNSLDDNIYTSFEDWQQTGMDTGSFCKDPLYFTTNISDYNYLRPQEGSPLINKGEQISIFTDFDGDLRTDGHVDIGAFEYEVISGIPVKKDNPMHAQAYPNPFDNQFTLSYTLSENSFVKFILTDIYGRRIMLFEDNVKIAGEHQDKIDTKHIDSGIYFYELFIDGNHRYTGRVIKL